MSRIPDPGPRKEFYSGKYRRSDTVLKGDYKMIFYVYAMAAFTLVLVILSAIFERFFI
jgi:hypothetical protein